MRMTRTLAMTLLLLALCTGLTAGGGDKKKAELQLTAAEQKLLELTNAERAKKKLPPLKLNPQLVAAARGHSANMAKQGMMEHILDGKTPGQRARAAGYEFDEIGENIAVGNVELEKIMDFWMGSKKHRDNILYPDYQEIGVGLATNDRGAVYYTQVFATPLKDD